VYQNVFSRGDVEKTARVPADSQDMTDLLVVLNRPKPTAYYHTFAIFSSNNIFCAFLQLELSDRTGSRFPQLKMYPS
jgi:hypothetical protein